DGHLHRAPAGRGLHRFLGQLFMGPGHIRLHLLHLLHDLLVVHGSSPVLSTATMRPPNTSRVSSTAGGKRPAFPWGRSCVPRLSSTGGEGSGKPPAGTWGSSPTSDSASGPSSRTLV